MAIVNLRQASAHLGFRTTTTLRRLLQAGELSAYVRSGPVLRATYLDVAPKGRPTLSQHVQAHTSCRGNSPLWGADYESWPKPSGNWTEVANSYQLSGPAAMGATTVDRAAVGDAAQRD